MLEYFTEGEKRESIEQFKDAWIATAVEGSWENVDSSLDDDDVHELYLFGA